MKRILFILSFIAIVSSCNSDDNEQPEQSNFYALTVNNSWVYKFYKYNYQTEVYDETDVIDEVSIIGTEEIYGHTYYKFKKVRTGVSDDDSQALCGNNGETISLLREYNGDLINDRGKLYFTNNNYDEIEMRIGSFFTIYSQLQENSEEITTDAGTFNCIYSKWYARNDNNELYPAEDKYYYKDGIGLIQSSISYVSSIHPPVIKRKLVSYNIQ